jgi:hypothetical protein
MGPFFLLLTIKVELNPIDSIGSDNVCANARVHLHKCPFHFSSISVCMYLHSYNDAGFISFDSYSLSRPRVGKYDYRSGFVYRCFAIPLSLIGSVLC